MKKRFQGFLNLSAVLLAALVCVSGLWGADFVMYGRATMDTTNSGGGDVQNSGRDLLYGKAIPAPDRIAPPTTAVTLKALSSSASDIGYLVVRGLNGQADSAWAEKVDSVLLAGATVKTLPGTWFFVNGLEFHDDSTNVGTIRLYHGAQSADSTLGIIEKRQGRGYWGVFALPDERSKIVPLSLRVSYAISSSADKRASGAVAVLAREPGDNWRVMDQILFRVGSGGAPLFVQYDERYTWDLKEHSQLRVAAAVTSSATVDVDARFQFGVRP